MRFLVDRVTVGQFFSEHLDFPLSTSFHQCAVLIPPNYMSPLVEGQTGEAWEPPQKVMLFGLSGSTGC